MLPHPVDVREEVDEDGDNQTLVAVCWAAYRTLQAKGVKETFDKIKEDLESYFRKKTGGVKNIEVHVMDFNYCDVYKVHTLNGTLASYKLIIKEIKDSDPYSSYKFKYEHVLVSEHCYGQN